MKRLLPVLLPLCLLLMGAARAPVLPTNGFYMNDYAALLSDGQRDEAFRIAEGLYADTGSRLALLTIPSLGGMEASDYADSVIRDWGLGNGDALYFVVDDPQWKGAVLMVGEGLGGVEEGSGTALDPEDSGALLNAYRAVAAKIYERRGVTPSAEMAGLLEEDAPVAAGPFSVGTGIIIAGLVVVAVRAFRVDRKYKAKYLKGNIRRRKSYARTYNEEDEYNNEKIYKITYDDQD